MSKDASVQLSDAANPVWRCFHCDEAFSDSGEAQAHFGKSEYSQPACQIDAAEYRAMEERMRRYNDDDSDMHRQIARMESNHQQALMREEEKGYARGLQALGAAGKASVLRWALKRLRAQGMYEDHDQEMLATLSLLLTSDSGPLASTGSNPDSGHSVESSVGRSAENGTA